MKIIELLLEYNEQRLINDFGNKLITRIKSDASAPKTSDIKIAIDNIANLDPTGNKELTFWLVLNYANGRISRYEDIASRAIPALIKFKALLKKPNLEPKLTIRDINQIKGLTGIKSTTPEVPDSLGLEDIIDQYQEKDVTSTSELSSSEEQNFYKTGQAKLIYNDAQVKVVVPKTKAASCFFGINTRWCTAAKENNMFADYNKQGPLYIVLFKKENERYQFHFETQQFMNERDKKIKPNELADKYPILWKIFTPIAEHSGSIILNAHPSEAIQLVAVKQYGYAIQYIKNPSEAIQLAAVKRNGIAIKFIKNPSEAMQLAAVKQHGYEIKFIKNPSEAIQLVAVKQDGTSIKFIKNPSEAIQLVAVKQDGYAIQYIKNPSEAIQLAAVKQDGYAIRVISNPSEEIKLVAVKQIKSMR